VCVHPYTHTHTYTHTQTHIQKHTYKSTHTKAHIHKHTYTNTHTHTYTHKHTYTHIHTHTRTHITHLRILTELPSPPPGGMICHVPFSTPCFSQSVSLRHNGAPDLSFPFSAKLHLCVYHDLFIYFFSFPRGSPCMHVCAALIGPRSHVSLAMLASWLHGLSDSVWIIWALLTVKGEKRIRVRFPQVSLGFLNLHADFADCQALPSEYMNAMDQGEYVCITSLPLVSVPHASCDRIPLDQGCARLWACLLSAFV
jgi:hypothetical protein